MCGQSCEVFRSSWVLTLLERYRYEDTSRGIPKEVQQYLDSVIQRLANEQERKAVIALFPEYSKVDNPSYTFMINKNELDAHLAQLEQKEGTHE